MTNRLLALAIAPVTLLVACAAPHKVPETVERTPVVFESDDAEQLFDEAASDRYDHHGSRNAHYNHELNRADRDGDGIITDDEAQHYAQ
jgi:hypothetical protein